ncbi:hypothetical protein ZEAMMB73_Zm00001d017754 [Zea mays]|uniref:Uncharacterized protein n=1 Tax=Zea mays TaxID=4577 RepID=A0A1D6HH95_MAIZE|nr:hypothetical protein ZEAMMB73_Zm00001d017754 [Zea mays]
MEEPGREGDSPGPPWAPSESSAFRAFVTAVGERAVASPSGSDNGDSVCSSNLRAVRKRPFVARLTTYIIQTFEKCNPEFKYSESLNPKRFLTNPAVPVHNHGLDNANSDLILYVNLELLNKKSSRRYVVQEMLGQGTFGQVAKCWDAETNSYVAVKVIKNQPAFYQQAIMEVSLLRLLNEKFDPDDEHHIVRMLDFFLYQNHLCIAFEMLGNNLYELLKRNSLRGLQMKYVRTFSRQILDALIIMKDAGIIHCDLKPENILIAPTVKTAVGVKVIDFGSVCMEGKTIYSYIQSRYYRSPEVLLGYPYTTAIDMWSFGCIVAELYIGLPLFPGASEYDVLCRMIEIIGSVLPTEKLTPCGQPPDDLLREAKNTGKFFKHVGSIYPSSEARNGASSAYRILSEDEIEARDSKKPKVGRWYFPRGRLDRLIYTYPWKNLSEGNLPETEKADCLALVDFLRGLVEFDPNKRWSPLQASYHPFITGEAFTGPYEPVQETPRIPVGRAAVVDHNPGGGHLLGAGLSPQGHQGDGVSTARFGAYAQGNSTYLHNALPNSSHYSWRSQRGSGSGLPLDPSSSRGSFPPTNYYGFPLHSDASADTLPSTSSVSDPADWDLNSSDKSLLQEDRTLSAGLSDLRLIDASGQTNRSSRLAPFQSHDILSSNPSTMNQRLGKKDHVSLVPQVGTWVNRPVVDGPREGGVAIRLQRADCHLHLGKILGESFSPESGGMPNATKLMASVVCICNSGLDYLLGVPTGIAICCVPPMSPRMFGSNDYMVRDMITVLVLCYTCTI